MKTRHIQFDPGFFLRQSDENFREMFPGQDLEDIRAELVRMRQAGEVLPCACETHGPKNECLGWKS